MFQSTTFKLLTGCAVVFGLTSLGLTGCAAVGEQWARNEREVVEKQLQRLEERVKSESESGSTAKPSPPDEENAANASDGTEAKKTTENESN